MRAVVRALQLLQVFSLYTYLGKNRWARNRSSGLAELYVLGWLSALVLLLLATPSDPQTVVPAGVAVGFVAAYRFADIVTFELLILLDRAARSLQSYTRSLVLLGLNLIEVSAAVAIFLRLDAPIGLLQAFISGFEIATLRGGIPTGAGLSVQLAVTLASTGALVLLAGALSMVVGLIAGTFQEGS